MKRLRARDEREREKATGLFNNFGRARERSRVIYSGFVNRLMAVLVVVGGSTIAGMAYNGISLLLAVVVICGDCVGRGAGGRRRDDDVGGVCGSSGGGGVNSIG
jgi:hypothetical protein